MKAYQGKREMHAATLEQEWHKLRLQLQSDTEKVKHDKAAWGAHLKRGVALSIGKLRITSTAGASLSLCQVLAVVKAVWSQAVNEAFPWAVRGTGRCCGLCEHSDPQDHRRGPASNLPWPRCTVCTCTVATCQMSCDVSCLLSHCTILLWDIARSVNQ